MKVIRYTLAIAGFLFLVWIGLFVRQRFQGPFISTTSPNGRLDVQIFEDQVFALPFLSRRVSFVANDSWTGQTATGHVASLEGYEQSFQKRFSTAYWVTESGLRLADTPRESTDVNNLLTIRNDSDKVIHHLVVRALDYFVLFGLKKGERVVLNVPRYPWQAWIEVGGKIEDGNPIPLHGMNFAHHDKIRSPLRYCVIITNKGTQIQSPLIEGWRFDGGTEPIAPDCEE